MSRTSRSRVAITTTWVTATTRRRAPPGVHGRGRAHDRSNDLSEQRGRTMRNTAGLKRRILSRSASVAVVGQGYVGLSLACAAAEAGFTVQGIDVDEHRVKALSAGELVVPGINEDI